MLVKPSDVHYSQNSISKYFDRRSQHHSHTIGQTLDQVLIGHCAVHDIPKISVLNIPGKGDKWFSVDNRRLWVLKQLERIGQLRTIEVRQVHFNYYQHRKKITTTNDGTSIRIRGDGDPEGTGHTMPDKCYPKRLLEKEHTTKDSNHVVHKASADRTKSRLTYTGQQDVTAATKRSILRSPYVKEKHTDRDKTRSPLFLQHENAFEKPSPSSGNYSSRLHASHPAITKESEALSFQSQSGTDNYADKTFSDDLSNLRITEPSKLMHKTADVSTESMASSIKVRTQDSSQAIGTKHHQTVRSVPFHSYTFEKMKTTAHDHETSKLHFAGSRTAIKPLKPTEYKEEDIAESNTSVFFHRVRETSVDEAHILEGKKETARLYEQNRSISDGLQLRSMHSVLNPSADPLVGFASIQECPEKYVRGVTAVTVKKADRTSHFRPESEAGESELMSGIKANALRRTERNRLTKLQYVEYVSEEEVEANMRIRLFRQRHGNLMQDTWSTEAVHRWS